MSSSEVAGLKLLVIGLDGATWDMMLPLIAQGDLTHMRRGREPWPFGEPDCRLERP